MSRKLIIKNILYGFLTWLIPFAASLLFFRPGGELIISHDLFKSIMIIVGSISGCYFLFRYFKFADSDFIKNGIIVGISWFIINIILDAIILIPMMKVSFGFYFNSIGLGYLVIPAISITMGFLLDKKTKTLAH